MTSRLQGIVVLAATIGVLAMPAGAIVPPRDCGTIRVAGKKYNIKTDQLSCTKAKDYSREFLKSGSKPSGYKCNRYQDSSLAFRCVKTSANPDKTFFAIKR
jgi:hypothetical protein